MESLFNFKYLSSQLSSLNEITLIIIIITVILLVNYFTKSSQKCPVNTFYKRSFPKYISLRHCPSSESGLESEVRPLAVIFSWLNAKDKSLDKFRQLWFDKGFDVLTVRTSIFDALFPPIGSQVVAKNVVKVLSDLHSDYNEIVIHSFSVGGYQFGEVLVQLTAHEKYSNILNSFKGFVMDSIVYAKDGAPGVSRTITTNRVLQPIIERTMALFYNISHRITIKHYNSSEEMVVRPPIKYPGLIFYSKDDQRSNFELNENLVENWIQRGNDIRSKCWDESSHILHYRHHQKEYEQELDSFLKSLILNNCRI